MSSSRIQTASMAPMKTKYAATTKKAPTRRRIPNRPRNPRPSVSFAPVSGWARNDMGSSRMSSPANAQKVNRKPPRLLRTAARSGPTTKPPTSQAPSRPMLRPRLSGSATMTVRRAPGPAVPSEKPNTMRPMTKCHNWSPTASRTKPQMPRAIPACNSLGAFPRSAWGAITRVAMKAAPNPEPMARPIPASEKPSSLRSSASIVMIDARPADIPPRIRK